MSDDPSDDTAAAAGRDRAGREQQIRRAREVLSDAGWLFDDFVNNEMRKVLVSPPEERDAREEAYRRARVATEMKAGLESLIETYEADMRLRQRRDQRRPGRDCRRADTRPVGCSSSSQRSFAELTFQRHDIEYDQPGIGLELRWRR